jgi:hypothetical protein
MVVIALVARSAAIRAFFDLPRPNSPSPGTRATRGSESAIVFSRHCVHCGARNKRDTLP